MIVVSSCVVCYLHEFITVSSAYIGTSDPVQTKGSSLMDVLNSIDLCGYQWGKKLSLFLFYDDETAPTFEGF